MDLSQRQRTFNENMQMFRAETAAQEAEYDKQIAAARHNAEQIRIIEQQKQAYTAQRAKQTAEFEKEATAGGLRTGADALRAQTELTRIQTQGIKSEQRGDDEAFRARHEIEMNAIEDAKVAAAQVLNSAKSTAQEKIAAEEQVRAKTETSYAAIIAMAKRSGQQTVEIARAERAEKQAILEVDQKIAQIRRQSVTDAMSEASSQGAMLQSQRTVLQAQISTQATLARVPGGRGGGMFGGGSQGNLAASYQKDAELVQQIADKQAAAWERIAQDANATAAQVEKAEAKISEIRAKAAQEQAQDFEKAYQVWQKAHEGMTKFLDSLGSGFQTMTNSLLKAVFSPQVDIIHAGLTTIRTTERGQEIRQAIGQMLLHGVQSAVDSVESAVSKVLGNMLAKAVDVPTGALGDVLGNWLAKSISGAAAPAVGSFLGGGASAAASAIPITTAITAQTPILVAAQEAGTSQIVAAITTSAVTQATIPKPLGFSGGGIVPSAAGGMVVGGVGGGLLSILHPQEMVLPANISLGMQRMIAGGGGGNRSFAPSLSYAPQIQAGRGGMSRSEFSGMLAAHKDDLAGIMRNEFRGGWRP